MVGGGVEDGEGGGLLVVVEGGGEVARVGIGNEFKGVNEVSDGNREDKPEHEFREKGSALVRTHDVYRSRASHLIPNKLLWIFLR